MTCHHSQIFISELRAQWCLHLVFLTGMPHTPCSELCYCSCQVWEDVYLLSITQCPRILQRDCHVFWHNTANRSLSLSTTYFCSPYLVAFILCLYRRVPVKITSGHLLFTSFVLICYPSLPCFLHRLGICKPSYILLNSVLAFSCLCLLNKHRHGEPLHI